MLGPDTDDLLAAHEYPTTTADIVDACGDHTIEHPNCTETIGEVFERLSSETFESPDEAHFALYSAMCREAVGRPGYSDRDPTPPGAPTGHENVSF